MGNAHLDYIRCGSVTAAGDHTCDHVVNSRTHPAHAMADYGDDGLDRWHHALFLIIDFRGIIERIRR
jgi:hypothetical protein